MTAVHQHHSHTSAEAAFEHHARQALRQAVIYDGWDHPVVDAAFQSVLRIRRVAGIRDGATCASGVG